MRRWSIIAVVIFVVLAGAILSLSPRTTQNVQSGFLGIFSPFLKSGSSLERRLTAFKEDLKKLDDLERENATLNVQYRELKAENLLLKDLQSENNRLRRALQYRERSVFKLVPARIIARDSTTWWNTVQIDRGFNDGIKTDMPVLTEEGLVGKTTTVAGDISTVLLIADEGCKVACKVEGTRHQGILRGTRTSTQEMPEMQLTFLPKDADLKPGQKVTTSGAGGVYPWGVFIGVVKEFTAGPLAGRATVVPGVDLTTLEDVFVVTGKKPE